jgi:hypothetical protein
MSAPFAYVSTLLQLRVARGCGIWWALKRGMRMWHWWALKRYMRAWHKHEATGSALHLGAYVCVRGVLINDNGEAITK